MQPLCNWADCYGASSRGSSREACRAPGLAIARVTDWTACDIPVAARQLLVTPAPYSDHVWWKWEVLDYLASADAIEGKRRTISGWLRSWATPPRSPLAKVGGAFFMSVRPRSNVRKKAPHT